MRVHERIKFRRNELNMSVDELAHKLNKNRATIYRYESGEIENLPIGVLEPLANVLKITPQQLMGWEEPEIYEVRTSKKNNTELVYKGLSKTAVKYFNRWYEEFGSELLTEEEYEKVIEYSKLLMSARKNK